MRKKTWLECMHLYADTGLQGLLLLKASCHTVAVIKLPKICHKCQYGFILVFQTRTITRTTKVVWTKELSTKYGSQESSVFSFRQSVVESYLSAPEITQESQSREKKLLVFSAYRWYFWGHYCSMVASAAFLLSYAIADNTSRQAAARKSLLLA